MRKDNKRQEAVKRTGILNPLVWAISFAITAFRRLKITKTNMEKIKPPYLLLCTHQSFYDYYVVERATFPYSTVNISEVADFIGGPKNWIMTKLGCICKRKFTLDISMIRNIIKTIEDGKIMVIYPEARYSAIGTNSEIPESMGKLIKKLNVPVVVLNMHGNYLSEPYWNMKSKYVKLNADMKCILDEKRIQSLSSSQIAQVVNHEYEYDEYKWQKENNIKIDSPDRTVGLENVIYKCPHCLCEYKLESTKTGLTCTNCNKSWEMSATGEMSACNGDTEFPHLPDWYEFQRNEVKKEIESGKYVFDTDVEIYELPDSVKGFKYVNNGHLRHDKTGFRLAFDQNDKPMEIIKHPEYACHIEYNYDKKGPCIDISTSDNTYYVFPKCKDFSVTKVSLATEEIYKLL